MNKTLLSFLILFFMINTEFMIFDFSKKINISSWRVVDDEVMGGLSIGNFKINENGNGLFYGKISLENNGGFSSLRYKFNQIYVSKYSKIILRIKGDGKTYQFRIKDNSNTYYSYIQTFDTLLDWQLVEISLSNMYPSFRGRKLALPNFSSKNIEEITFLIGNKKEESFQLEIDKIYLK